MSDHKRAVQTIKRFRGQPETGLEFRLLPTKMCVLVYTDSALRNCRGRNQNPVSDHKRAVQTIKRLRCQPEIGLKFRPLPTKMCVLVYTDSALRNADAVRR